MSLRSRSLGVLPPTDSENRRLLYSSKSLDVIPLRFRRSPPGRLACLPLWLARGFYAVLQTGIALALAAGVGGVYTLPVFAQRRYLHPGDLLATWGATIRRSRRCFHTRHFRGASTFC